jgi:hypothetical protein
LSPHTDIPASDSAKLAGNSEDDKNGGLIAQIIPLDVSKPTGAEEEPENGTKKAPLGRLFQSWQSFALPEDLVVADAHVRSFPLVEALDRKAPALLFQIRSAQVCSTTSQKLVQLHEILSRN